MPSLLSQIFWNAFLSTLSHAPIVQPDNMLDAFQQYSDSLPEPLHVRAAEFADALYSATRPLHEQAAQFSEALKLPLVSNNPCTSAASVIALMFFNGCETPTSSGADKYSDLGQGGHDLSKLKIPTTIKVSPTRVHPESSFLDNWDF
jgi:hypothetical protein